MKVSIRSSPLHEHVNFSQVAVSHLGMLVLRLSCSKSSMNCRNRVGVCSKNCLMCCFMLSHCWGDWKSLDNLDLLRAMVRAIPSFVVTSAVWSLGDACGGWAGSLWIA